MTVSDIFTWGSQTILVALVGIYLSSKLGGNAAKFVGIGTGIYYLTRSLTQIPIGIMLDKINHDKDEIIALVIGSILMGLPYLFYSLIKSEYTYYALQAVFGLGASMNLVSWRKLFSQNLDTGKVGIEYGIYETLMSAVTAIFSIIAGIVANTSLIYFERVIYALGVIMISGSIFAWSLASVINRKTINI
ncbi:MFS transporter [Patescibacteria group bacterium]